MSLKFTTVPTKTLAESINSSATSFRLNNIRGWDNETNLAAADFGVRGFGVFRNATNSVIEIFEFDPATIANATITIVRRGLQFDGNLTTEVADNKRSWTKGDTYVDLGTDVPQFFQFLKEYIDGIAIAGAPDAGAVTKGITRLSVAPASPTAPIAVGDNDGRVPTQAENDAMAGDGGTPSATNPYITRHRQMLAGETINGATTPVPVYQNKTDNEFYACDANDNTRFKFLGFAVSNGVNGGALNVQFTGVVPGFTGLQEGEKYYVQDAVGTIGTSPGTTEILVGIAISETQLLIVRPRLRASGTTSSGTATGSAAITLGFRPSRVRVTAVSCTPAGTAMGILNFVWVNGAASGITVSMDAGGSEILTTGTALNEPGNTTALMTYSITSVTDTGFTLSWTETGSVAISQQIVWEAEGEL